MQLSNSSLSVFCDCPRCFFLDKKLGIPRPRGIFSSLPGGIDKILKEQMDANRGKLPEMLRVPETAGYVLFDDPALMKKYRHWKSSPLKYTDAAGNVLVGALDDLLHSPTAGLFAAHDWKTKGSEPNQAYCEQYYQRQIDIYTLLGQAGGLKMADFGTLGYFWPIGTLSGIRFLTKTFVLKANPEAAKKSFNDAIACLNSYLTPPAKFGCEYCSYTVARHSIETQPVTA